jgi:hypothetical protein
MTNVVHPIDLRKFTSGIDIPLGPAEDKKERILYERHRLTRLHVSIASCFFYSLVELGGRAKNRPPFFNSSNWRFRKEP